MYWKLCLLYFNKSISKISLSIWVNFPVKPQFYISVAFINTSYKKNGQNEAVCNWLTAWDVLKNFGQSLLIFFFLLKKPVCVDKLWSYWLLDDLF